MAVGLQPPQQVLKVPGIRLGAVSAGIGKAQRPDLALIELADGGVCSAVFTRNAFAAAPVRIARSHLEQRMPRFCLINAGNANAGTGAAGLQSAEAICEGLAQAVDCDREAILPFSTGVIGEPLPVDRIQRSLAPLYTRLEEDAWMDAARAIMTTDTLPKAVSRQVVIDATPVTVTGIAKGAGMIRPDMATMLAFIGTDAKMDRNIADRLLSRAVTASFNRICVDGDTSTNDACVLLASGAAPMKTVDSVESSGYDLLCDALEDVCAELARAIVRDGEGATKFITIHVTGGGTAEECRQAAYAVATSPLVKTACYASDPNWGRILAAVGRAGIADLDIEGVSLYLGEVLVAEKGGLSGTYTEADGLEVMQREEIEITIELNRGDCRETVWTCDLSHEYVRINAEYRT